MPNINIHKSEKGSKKLFHFGRDVVGRVPRVELFNERGVDVPAII
jgi:hypothetical protein